MRENLYVVSSNSNQRAPTQLLSSGHKQTKCSPLRLPVSSKLHDFGLARLHACDLEGAVSEVQYRKVVILVIF